MLSEKEVKRLGEELDENIASLLQSREQNDEVERELRAACDETAAAHRSRDEALTEKYEVIYCCRVYF